MNIRELINKLEAISLEIGDDALVDIRISDLHGGWEEFPYGGIGMDKEYKVVSILADFDEIVS